MSLTELKIKVLESEFLSGGPGGESIPCLFQFLDTICIGRLWPTSRPEMLAKLSQAINSLIFSILLKPSNYENIWDYNGPTQTTQDNLFKIT